MASETCHRCGKTLEPGVGPNSGFRHAPTGEWICGQCMMEFLESVTGSADDDPEVKAFVDDARREIARRTKVDPAQVRIIGKSFAASDVEIGISGVTVQVPGLGLACRFDEVS